MAEAREEARKHEEWKAHFCAGVKKQIQARMAREQKIISCQSEPRKPKLRFDFSSIEAMDDESDSTTPTAIDQKIEITDSKEKLLRRVRKY